MAYATLVEAKLFLGVPATDTEDDPLIELALDAASQEIDKFCDRLFGEDDEEIPSPIRQACLIQAGRLWKRKDSLFGVAGSPEFGSELRLLSRLDPDVELLLRGQRHRWWVV